jgi:hypothetical protein
MADTTSGTPEQGHVGRRTVLKGVLGAGALVGTHAALTGPANASVNDGERGVEHGWGKVADAFRKNFSNPGEVGDRDCGSHAQYRCPTDAGRRSR